MNRLFILVFAVLIADGTDAQQAIDNLSAEEKVLLQEFRKSVPPLVKKYSQLSLEYRKVPQQGNEQRKEISRIYIRDGGYYRWDVETDKEILVYLALPERCYKFGRKKGADRYSLISKGGSVESKNTALMIISTEVVRAPFAADALPIWYEYDILDDPSLDRSSQKMFERISTPKCISVEQTAGNDGDKLVTITNETEDGEYRQKFPDVFIRNRSWALKSSRAYAVDDSGKKFYTDYTRTYNADSMDFPLLKQVSNLTFFSDNNELSWSETFLVSKIELYPPPLSVFDPKQFLPQSGNGSGEIECSYTYTWTDEDGTHTETLPGCPSRFACCSESGECVSIE
ncbi:hypothetical protein FACS18942_05820 [Planctomycetales bacterium]|nr:hypothetical protein FACS18942_05820 [Planctomycetales bacterium]